MPSNIAARRGEILIVNHDGRGWWDPQSAAKGDIFDLVQYLDPNLNFGQVRRELRRFVSVVPTFPQALSGRAKNDPGAGCHALNGSASAAVRLSRLGVSRWSPPAVRQSPQGRGWGRHPP